MADLNITLDDFILGLWELRYVVANSGENISDIVWVPTTEEVVEPATISRLANLLAGLELARRQIPDYMADQIYGYLGKIIDKETGREIDMDKVDIDALFNDDPSFRWLSDFLGFAKKPPAQRGQARIAERLKMIQIALEIGDRKYIEPIGLKDHLTWNGPKQVL